MNDTTTTRESTTAAPEREAAAIMSAVSTALRTASTALRIVSTTVRGVNAVSALLALLRSLDGSDGLAWPARARGRRPWEAVTIFGAGVALGAGIGVMFAPAPGADLRRAILGRSAK